MLTKNSSFVSFFNNRIFLMLSSYNKRKKVKLYPGLETSLGPSLSAELSTYWDCRFELCCPDIQGIDGLGQRIPGVTVFGDERWLV